MTDPLAATVRNRMRVIAAVRGISLYRLGVELTGDGCQFRTQMLRDGGLSTRTITRWAEALGIDPLELLTEPTRLERAS